MSRHSSTDATTPMPMRRTAAGSCPGSSRHTRMARAFESTTTSRQFSGRSSTTMSSPSAAAIRPRDPCTTKTLGSGKPFDSSQRCVWICAVAPADCGRLVRKMISQRRSAAIDASR
ncbi:MAG: hypothetical protein DMG01_23990 [Acidobacteria bacterium]|nr:MAG: hypothetical protein DMG01_23990 [Acidobacteriota bacterium]